MPARRRRGTALGIPWEICVMSYEVCSRGFFHVRSQLSKEHRHAACRLGPLATEKKKRKARRTAVRLQKDKNDLREPEEVRFTLCSFSLNYLRS